VRHGPGAPPHPPRAHAEDAGQPVGGDALGRDRAGRATTAAVAEPISSAWSSWRSSKNSSGAHRGRIATPVQDRGDVLAHDGRGPDTSSRAPARAARGQPVLASVRTASTSLDSSPRSRADEGADPAVQRATTRRQRAFRAARCDRHPVQLGAGHVGPPPVRARSSGPAPSRSSDTRVRAAGVREVGVALEVLGPGGPERRGELPLAVDEHDGLGRAPALERPDSLLFLSPLLFRTFFLL